MPFTRRCVVGSILASLLPIPSRSETPSGSDPRTLEARPGTLRLRPAPAAETAVWTLEGTVPGPLLRCKLGEEIHVRLINGLDQPTTLYWHGMRIDNAMAGVGGLTQPPVPPGGRFDYRFTPPDSGLYWYHPHVAPSTAEQVARGLYGAVIVDEAAPPPVDADLLLVLDDWRLGADAAIAGPFDAPSDALRTGWSGALVTVASQPAPLEATYRPGARLRLRLVSAVNARLMAISFGGAKPRIVAIDGQPCEAFEPVRQTIPVGPGACFDILVDLPATAGDALALTLRGLDGAADAPLARFKAEGEPLPAREPIGSLPANGKLPAAIPLERALKVDLAIDGGARTKDGPVPAAGDARKLWTLAGTSSPGFGGKPLFTVRRGQAVSLGFVNKTAFVQQMHVGGHAMRLLHDLDDGWEPYWRTSVLVPESRTKHVAFIADNPGRWPIESGILARQVTGLAGWFEVT